MTIRAVIFDVYGTLFTVAPAPPDADEQWNLAWHDMLCAPPRLSLTSFSDSCKVVIARENAASREFGVEWPEIYWPAVVQEILPEMEQLDEFHRAEFLYRLTHTWHTVRLMPHAAPVLRKISQTGLLLGIASNAQPYAPRELDRELHTAGLSSAMFDPVLCFWSFEHGFSKPDPRVFRILTMRLAARRIAASQILMVGDHFTNDIAPALAQGWQVWQLAESPISTHRPSGDWHALLVYLGL
jgi:putative hydrolase of the HAD superfamily